MNSAPQEIHLASEADNNEENSTLVSEKRSRCDISGGKMDDAGELAAGKRLKMDTLHQESSESRDAVGILAAGDGNADMEGKSGEMLIEADGNIEGDSKQLVALDSQKTGDVKTQKVFRCEVCSIDCHGERNLRAHCFGRKHKRIQKLADRKTSLEAGDSVPDEEEDLKESTVKVSLDSVKEQFMCHPCNLKCNSQTDYELHVSGKRHLACLKKQANGMNVSLDEVVGNIVGNEEGASVTRVGGSGDKSVAEFLVENNESTGARSVLDSMLLRLCFALQGPRTGSTSERDHERKVYDLCGHDCGQSFGDNGYVMMHVGCFLTLMKSGSLSEVDKHKTGDKQDTLATNEWNCKVCRVEFGGKLDCDNHMMGKKHAAQIKKLQLRCDVCGVNCSSSKVMESHLSGKAHRSKLRLVQRAQCGGMTVETTLTKAILPF